MRKIPPPEIDPVTIFFSCVDCLRNADLRDRLYNSVFEFIQLYELFEKKVQITNLRSLPVDHLPTDVTKDEWIKLYDQKLVQSESARIYYDIIKTSSPNAKCPLCGAGQVSQLDHHLPKSRYPLLSVALLNLFPICSDCNKNKLSNIPQNAADEPLHPYFDDIDSEEWLIAKIENVFPVSFTFSVRKPENWPNLLFQRVQNHFERLKLGNLFASEASEELVSRLASLSQLYNNVGEQGVRAYLKDAYESNKDHYRNSWRTATFKALWKSDWFCRGGFLP